MNFGPYAVIKLTPAMIETAHQMAKDLGHLRNSIEEGAGNITGFCGEIACKKFLGIPLEHIQNTYHFDIIYNGQTYDIKSKRRKDAPRNYYEASVANFNTSQQCNFYLHTSVTWPERLGAPTEVHLCGFLTKQQYMQQARFLKKGDLDGSNKFTVKADCWNMFYKDLLTLKEIKEIKVN